jgi:hypothetical protein
VTASTTEVQAEGFVASPLSTTCAEILSQADHECIGVSPFNSYFAVGRIRQLAEWAYGRFARVDFFIPDGPSAYTLQALGYPPQRAEWKAERGGAPQGGRDEPKPVSQRRAAAQGRPYIQGLRRRGEPLPGRRHPDRQPEPR